MGAAVSWQVANRIAHIAAAQAHGALDVDPSQFPVQVASAIDRADIDLFYKPMRRGFGHYFNFGPERRGILINRGLSRSARRQTEAHELGHDRLNHDPAQAESLCTIDATVGPASIRSTGWSAQEKAAEAFAAWFLMPRRALLGALTALGTTKPVSPAHVFQLSLLLGTSYRATVRHLVSLKLITPAQSRDWAKASPATFKRGLVAGDLPTTREVDVWQVDRLVIDTVVHGFIDDLFIVREPARIIDIGAGLMVAPEFSGPQSTVLAIADHRGDTSMRLAGGASATPVQVSIQTEPRPSGAYEPRDCYRYEEEEDPA